MATVSSNVHVVNAAEVPPLAADGVLSERLVLGPHTAFEVLELSVLECAPGRCRPRATGTADLTLFVLSGRGRLRVDDELSYELEPDTGAHLAAGEQYELEADEGEGLRLVAVTIPRPDPARALGQREVVRRLADQQAQAATTDRWFRIVHDPDSGLRSATHFVGYIPAARAPDHFHEYDEAIYVLSGEGIFHVGDRTEVVGPGSCIQLPARTVHCLESTGQEAMRVVAVFRPAGSPAAAYYPDGTPAYEFDSSE